MVAVVLVTRKGCDESATTRLMGAFCHFSGTFEYLQYVEVHVQLMLRYILVQTHG
jgi:hypothetical protein